MIVEVVQFKTKSGISDAEFMAASQKAHEYLSKTKGFVSRELLKNKDGIWMDFVHFETEEDAQTVAEEFGKAPKAQDFEKMIDPSTAKMTRFKVAKKY